MAAVADGALIVVMRSDRAAGRFADLAVEAMRGGDGPSILCVDALLAELDGEATLALIARRRSSGGRLFLVAFGETCGAALRLSEAAVADGTLLLAPDAEIFSRASAIRDRTVHVVPDEGLPSDALLFVLDQMGGVAPLLHMLIEGGRRAMPLAAWRAAFAHRIEVDTSATHYDAGGALHLAGRLCHRGTRALAFDERSHRIRVAARILDADGVPVAGMEGRAAIAGTRLDPDARAHFRLTLPRFDPERGDSAILFSLVDEGAFWFSDLGFPPTILASESSAPLPGMRADSANADRASSTVALLYRALLGREADSAGLNHYARLLGNGELDEHRLALTLIESAEFRGAAQARQTRVQHDDPRPKPLLTEREDADA
jgi:hypothetical protein